MFPVAYWKTSTLVSNLVTSLYFRSCGSQMCLSLNTRCNNSFGGASTSVDTRQRRSGCPSPTFLYAISTLLSAGLLTVTQPRLLLERITEAFSAYKSSINLLILFTLDLIVLFLFFLSFTFVYSKTYNLDSKIWILNFYAYIYFILFAYYFYSRIN